MPRQLVRSLFRRRPADLRLRPGTQTLRQMRAELHAAVGAAMLQLLRVRVGDHEIDTLQIEGDHVVDGVAAAAAHADHGDPWGEVRGGGVGRDFET